ncbi:hypothetical protein [Pseudohalioglobus lutimaris]|uniref:Uncharacterized protein n=1 Tax=Pseudohalioglobus lutimaris TaxID=1737061 RepID=A0A2N5WZN6_9GAMM|nr:hypothetical protein [Pseudohalioglobus lutimaris]PLW67700.1 hypothetical protein C0039_15995 [Pseudohalioglobus lutimaris]
MHNTAHMTHVTTGLDTRLAAAMMSEAVIDPVTLSQLDVSLFRSLLKIGHPKERICSALDLSYAEYDCIVGLMESAQDNAE